MSRSAGFYWNQEVAENRNNKPSFVWTNQTIKVRRELAQYSKIREKNVPILQVIAGTIKTFFKGL